MVEQKTISLKPHSRGFHLITNEIIKHIPKITGVVNVFIKHTSASLTINENADPTVREDFETHFNKTRVNKPDINKGLNIYYYSFKLFNKRIILINFIDS